MVTDVSRALLHKRYLDRVYSAIISMSISRHYVIWCRDWNVMLMHDIGPEHFLHIMANSILIGFIPIPCAKMP